jgi:sigma-E factor negative regulatory protein RseC
MTAANAHNRITHQGRVVDVFGGGVDVSIVSESACGACGMKKACGMSESKEKSVTVYTPDWENYRVGEAVTVSMTQGMGTRAILYVYLLPVLVVLAGLVVLTKSGVSELVSGLAAMGLLILYYAGVYLLRHRIEREIRFEIRKTENNRPQ